MNAVVSLLCVAGAALGMLLVAMLLIREHHSQARMLLACLIGVACVDELLSAVAHLSQAPAGSAVMQLRGFQGLLFAPLMFLYFRAQYRALRVRGADAWHFSSFVVLQSLAVFEFFVPEAVPGLFLRPCLTLASLLIVCTYALACIRLIHSGPLPRQSSVFHNSAFTVLALMAGLASYLLGGGADVLPSAKVFGADLADAVLSCALAALTCSALRRAMYRQQDAKVNEVVVFPRASTEPEKLKYGNNRLPDFARESIVAGLNQHMLSVQPWLKIDLTLGQLATEINVSPHHLSQIINSEFGKSFACYINQFRVSAACELLARDTGSSVLDIALDSGFSSKSSFNASFKKHTGMTPSEYRKRFQDKNYLVA